MVYFVGKIEPLLFLLFPYFLQIVEVDYIWVELIFLLGLQKQMGFASIDLLVLFHLNFLRQRFAETQNYYYTQPFSHYIGLVMSANHFFYVLFVYLFILSCILNIIFVSHFN